MQSGGQLWPAAANFDHTYKTVTFREGRGATATSLSYSCEAA